MKRFLLFIIGLLISLSSLQAQTPGELDLTFNAEGINFGDGPNAGVLAISVQADGKILIGGGFSFYNGKSINGIARLNSDGSLDTYFKPAIGANIGIRTIALQPNGKILLGAYSYDGTLKNYVLRLNADGSLDNSFDPGMGADNFVNTIVLQPDGKILVGGYFTSYNGKFINRIARLNADGSLDTSFLPGTGANNPIFKIALQPDGKIFIGGYFSFYNGISRNNIARLNADGSLDTTFDPGLGADVTVFNVILQPDGKILIAGYFSSYNGISINAIARLNDDGSLDTSFKPDTGQNEVILSILAITLQPDGKILIGGEITSSNGIFMNRFARLNTDGSLDTLFDSGTMANSSVSSMALQSDRKILIGGGRGGITRLYSDGRLDTSLNPETGANGLVRSTTLQSDGKILIGGEFTSYNGTSRSYIARINTDGSLDTSFYSGPGANNLVWTMALQPDGKILIGGLFNSYNGASRSYIARLNTDGTLDFSFNPGTGANGQVYNIALQPDGKILLGGSFTAYSGTAINRIARLNADGSLDTTFKPSLGANNTVKDILIQPDGKILIGGVFTAYNGSFRSRIARLNADGSLDTTFNPGQESIGPVWTLALQPDGKILIGGEISSGIARLNADGRVDTSFNRSSEGANKVFTIALQPDGKILIGGDFNSYNGVSRNRIARLNADGILDTSFDPGTGTNSEVWTTAIQPDGKILIGGNFTGYDGISRVRIARIYGGERALDEEPPVPDLENLEPINAPCQVNFEDLTIPTATDNVDGTIQGTTDQSIFPITTQGTTTITWTYTDKAGNSSSQNQEIVIQDTLQPEVLVKNYTLQLDNTGNGILMVEDIDNGSFDNCSIKSRVLSQTTFTCANEGSNLVIITVTDAAGNSASANATVMVLAPKIPITVNINSTVVPNENMNVVIFDGATSSFGVPSNTTLSATGIPSSYTGLTYQWYWRNTPSGSFQSGPVSTSPSIVVNAAGDFTREYKLIVSSNSGCIAEKTISVISVEASCGKGNKVAVCHVTPNGKRKTLCVSYDAVDALLKGNPGLFIGSCNISYRMKEEPELITVPWNTPLEEVKEKIAAQSANWFDRQKINLSISADSYNPLASGLYEMKVDVQETAGYILEESISVQVLVLNKPKALDIELSNQVLPKNVGFGTVIGTLNTIDPVDDIHTYSMDPNPDLEIRGNQLIWKGTNTPAAQMKVTVFSTDRAGQTMSKEIQLSREIGPNQFILYPNPAQNETNIMVDLDEGANVEIRVFDAVGRMVIQDSIYCEKTFIQKLNLNGLAPGMYMVQVKIGYIVMTERLIKR